MDGDFGVEGIRNFNNLRAAMGEEIATDLPYTYNITNGVYDTLRNAGYANRFYWTQDDVWELDLQSAHLNGLDASMADDVDLYFLSTHGRNDDGVISLGYNSEDDDWIGHSTDWRLGDRDIEWLAIYSCDTVNIDDFGNQGYRRYNDIFYGLHLLLGSYEKMYTGSANAHRGRNFAENLLDGDTVKSAWMDGVSYNNHPAVLSAERDSTWNGGSVDWPNTTMELDKYHGRGGAVSDIDHNSLYWIGVQWL